MPANWYGPHLDGLYKKVLNASPPLSAAEREASTCERPKSANTEYWFLQKNPNGHHRLYDAIRGKAAALNHLPGQRAVRPRPSRRGMIKYANGLHTPLYAQAPDIWLATARADPAKRMLEKDLRPLVARRTLAGWRTSSPAPPIGRRRWSCSRRRHLVR